MRPALGFTVLLATGLLAVPVVAHADGFISPNVGVNFGGQAGGTLRNAVNVAADEGSKINWGVAAGWMCSREAGGTSADCFHALSPP